MSYIITATAPTHYQLTSLQAFGCLITENGNGSFYILKEFDTEVEAENFLLDKGDKYAETEEETLKYREQILRFGTLTLDAVTAYINEKPEQQCATS